jgi:hypothetical protein
MSCPAFSDRLTLERMASNGAMDAMMKSRFTEAQKVAEVAKKHAISEQTIHWRQHFAAGNHHWSTACRIGQRHGLSEVSRSRSRRDNATCPLDSDIYGSTIPRSMPPSATSSQICRRDVREDTFALSSGVVPELGFHR